ncbi:neutral zinc metallopeptidase [Akkermansiaceae bacterium]|nr:neutral zinc metallopeptidase [Akkermansiaceae bacterium]MDB4143400.1 neutral zinc metallopeptidase [Akkermansiaceae bacterium]MDB4258655.1 neutral zinc metallopeptidase [Akkermansiaceae bacterium]MDB4333161.1 neutral zinc metallopeptidase [Akkermansiaceae bacterium]MDB4381705.1 neutral zinc metallopeptidase [Akkermansiaceae bacterium]
MRWKKLGRSKNVEHRRGGPGGSRPVAMGGGLGMIIIALIAVFGQMKNQFNAGGDFAYAYVIAHEVGHHVQKLLGRTDYVHKQKGRISELEYNRLSVRLELQADFLAGVWANHADKRMRASTGAANQGDTFAVSYDDL